MVQNDGGYDRGFVGGEYGKIDPEGIILPLLKRIAYPKNKNPSKTTLENIADHNILETYNYNLNLLREYKEKTGTGIIHFNNPLQLLELLIGSILAGNNGVLQEFSQIAHLLHHMKVITKKQLNDLLKKYILNK